MRSPRPRPDSPTSILPSSMEFTLPGMSPKSISTRSNNNATTLQNTLKMSPATSQEISPPSSETAATVRILPGPSALTPFEGARLLQRLQAIDAGVTGVTASYLYVLQVREGEVDYARLHELLGSNLDLPPGPSIWIAPR